MRWLPALLLFALPTAARAGCTLTVLAAASLQAPLTAGAADFEKAHPGCHVVVSGAATGVLVKQVQAGAPADVIVGAAVAPIEALHAQHLADAPRDVARNQLVVAAPASSKLALAGLEGLRAPAFARIAIGRPKVVPAGDYAAQALQATHLAEALGPKLVYAENVTQVLQYVRRGDVDAGFVYASDAQRAGAEVRVLLRIAPALHQPIVYPAAVLSHTGNRALAEAYVTYLASPAGQAALHRAGFLPP